MISLIKIAYVDELALSTRHGGSATLTIQLLNQIRDSGEFETELISFHSGINTNIPDKIKLFPNIREIFILPFLGAKFVPSLEKKYDLIHFSSTTTAAFYKSYIPTVLTTHCIFSRQIIIFEKVLPSQYKIFFNRMSYNLFKKLERRSFNNIDHIIVPKISINRFLIDELKIPSDKISIISQGIDIDFFKPASFHLKKDNIVLFVGRGTIAKGFDTLINATDLINANIVAVAPHISRSYKKMAKKKKNLTLITTKLNHNELIKLYQKASVFIMPSLAETGPLVTLEAMACGLPIVCTLEGGGDFVENDVNGFIVHIRNPATLAEKVNYILNNIDIAKKFGKESRKIAESFSIQNTVKKTIEIYKSLIN